MTYLLLSISIIAVYEAIYAFYLLDLERKRSDDPECMCIEYATKLGPVPESRDGMTPEQRVQVGIDMQRVLCELQRREAR